VKGSGESGGRIGDGVSKLAKIEFQTQEEAASRKYFPHRCCWRWRGDVRVILIKLADRLA